MTARSAPEPQLYSVRAAAGVLGIGLTTTWKFITAGILDTVCIGGRRMVRSESLNKLIAEGTPRAKKRAVGPVRNAQD